MICSASRSRPARSDAICQRASDALAGPHLQLQDWVLDQGAVHVDETGWRTRGEGRALWTATTPDAAFFQIAEHCNREQFNALIGTSYPGIVISDRWNGYSHLDPNQRQVCWSHLQRDFRRHADGLAEQKTFGEHGLALTDRCSPPGAPTSTSTTTATGSRPRSHRSRPSCEQLLEDASPKSQRNRWHRQFANNLLKVWPALWTFTPIDGRRADQQPRRTRAPRTGHPPKTLARHPKRQRRAIRRTRALRRRHLPPATPLAVHLPQRTAHRPQPRRPIPRAHLRGPRD